MSQGKTVDIEMIRAFLHAGDDSDVWDILPWLNDQHKKFANSPESVSEAFHYYLGCLDEPTRDRAIQTLLRACRTVNDSVVMTWQHGSETREMYGVVTLSLGSRSSLYTENIVSIYPGGEEFRCKWADSRHHIIFSCNDAAKELPKVLKNNFGDLMLTKSKMMIKDQPEEVLDKTVSDYSRQTLREWLADPDRSTLWREGRDRRRTIGNRISSLRSLIGDMTMDKSNHWKFTKWTEEAMAAYCFAFILGRPRGGHIIPRVSYECVI